MARTRFSKKDLHFPFSDLTLNKMRRFLNDQLARYTGLGVDSSAADAPVTTPNITKGDVVVKATNLTDGTDVTTYFTVTDDGVTMQAKAAGNLSAKAICIEYETA